MVCTWVQLLVWLLALLVAPLLLMSLVSFHLPISPRQPRATT